MKALFTIHAGEYLVDSYIERNFLNLHLRLPFRDTGIDLLVTNKKFRRGVSLQVNFWPDDGRGRVLIKTEIYHAKEEPRPPRAIQHAGTNGVAR